MGIVFTHSASIIRDILSYDRQRLEAALDLDADSARIEVQCLLQAVLQVNRAWLLAHPEMVLDTEQAARYAALMARRLSGAPIAYLLGEREFFGLTFKVTEATLIPRQDTELLVELALRRISQPRSPGLESLRVLDLGAGCGAVAIAIAHARPDVVVTAVDVSQEALEVARNNALALNLGNLRLLRSDWFSALDRGHGYDIIVSNPPYIAENDGHLMRGDLRFEPRLALVSGVDGLDDIRRIATGAKVHLNNNGWLLIEHGYDQAARVRNLLEQAGFCEIFSEQDIAGIERVSGGKKPPVGGFFH